MPTILTSSASPNRSASPSTSPPSPSSRSHPISKAAGYSVADITALEQETKFYTDIRSAIKQHSGEELDIKPYEADMRHLINRGSCNPQAKHIRLNTELVKKPKDLLEYVIVHELAHLIDPNHSDRFVAILDYHYPTWREARTELNELRLVVR